MIADVILGNNIDTSMWIADLRTNKSENIIVIDYEHFMEPDLREEVMYISSIDAKNYLNNFDSVYFYKSVYVYPGMGGQMSTLYKK